MRPDSLPPKEPEQAPSSDADLLRDQREANEKLVLATLRAHDDADLARGAKESAEHAVEEMRSMAEFRERLIGIVGHDLRNPLNTMLMASGLLLGRGELSDADAGLVNRIVNSGQRMARMITQVLDFTRARLGGGFALQLVRTDLGDVCRNIIDELRLHSSAEIVLAVDGDLAGAWDADRLGAVISNIAGNAIDHAASETSVVVHVHGGDAAVVILEITNHGVCIPAEELPTIFKAYRSGAYDTKRGAGHMGLGLYISCEIVRSHGGSLDVRSSDGTTTFTVRLPRVPALPASSPLAA